ncbi:hypothetical protein Tco_1151811, partial [Tanacetum coccineum]
MGGAGATWQHPIRQPPVTWRPRLRRSMTCQPPVNGGQPSVDGGQWRRSTAFNDGGPPVNHRRTTGQRWSTVVANWVM